MAAPSSPTRPSGPWALLWLGGMAGAAWVPLLLVDVLPWASPSAPLATAPAAPGGRATAAGAKPAASDSTAASLPPPQPLLASLAQPPTSFGARSSLWLDAERPATPQAPWPPGRAFAAEAGFPPEPEPTATATFAPAPSLSPARQQPLPGSVLLGGPLTLASLQEKPMVPAARLEQTLRARSADRLSAVPLHWRPTMEALIQGKNQVMPAEVVRLPAPHLKEPEEYPMAVQPDGVAETPVNPSAPSRQALERWAERQSPTPQDTVRPVVVVLEPLAAEPAP
jgi:hypothetical protein